MSSATPAASQGTSLTSSNATVSPDPSTTNVPSGHSSANTAEASSAPIGHARSYSGTMGASGATGSASGRGRDWGFGSLGAGACEGASTTTLSISSTGVFGAAGSSTASFSAANENGTGHNNPNTNSAQSAKAALILSAAFHGGILYAVGFVINRNHFYCSRVSSTLAQ